MATFRELAADTAPAGMLFDIAHQLVWYESDGFTEHLERLSREARLVFVLWNFDNEIHNGGFDQFFFNSLGDQCEEILGYLDEVGAENCHRMLRSAMSQFPGGEVPADRLKRQEVLLKITESKSVSDAFNALDGEFYRYEDGLSDLLEEFIRKHPDVTVENLDASGK
ncbi:MAG: DMP19 family protein [Candidatus Hydrogenedentes bacterium]|nr:DMP19 family protein [Candidatus Hydrogenedentota bacterium]